MLVLLAKPFALGLPIGFGVAAVGAVFLVVGTRERSTI
jgi:hypothetical protein